MSRNALSPASERINRVCNRRWPDVRLQTVAADDINRLIKQFRDVILERDILVDADSRRRIDLDHDIDVALGPVIATRAGPE